MRVRVYYNLHRKCLSVMDVRTRRVVDHRKSVVMRDVTFRVSEAGRQRVLRTGQKNVHAFVEGTLVDRGRRFAGRRASYNPRLRDCFYDVGSGIELKVAKRVSIEGKDISYE